MATLAPMLFLKNVLNGIDYYTKAFGAIELRRISNDDTSVHVAEISIGNALLRLHEEVLRNNEVSPSTLTGTTTIISLLVENPDTIYEKAVAAGATEVHAMQDYEYGYRQGTISDPFGHRWQIEKASLVKELFPTLEVN